MRLHDLVSGLIIVSSAALFSTTVAAQSTERLTLGDAERIGIQNHPQIQAAREMTVAADQMVRQARSAYYPTANGSLSGRLCRARQPRRGGRDEQLHHL
jgi:outer membrane protein TolC